MMTGYCISYERTDRLIILTSHYRARIRMTVFGDTWQLRHIAAFPSDILLKCRTLLPKIMQQTHYSRQITESEFSGEFRSEFGHTRRMFFI